MQNQTDSSQENNSSRYARLLIWAGALMLGLLIAMKILSLGFLPPDDALRHVGKVVSDKPWSEIVVLREGFAEDQHPGWHAILGAMYRGFHLNEDKLLWFSVFALFVFFWFALMGTQKRPEAMLIALFVANIAAPGTYVRLMFGRPFIFAMGVCVILLQLWTSERIGRRWRVVLTTLLLTVSVWIHGSWYLFGIMLMAFALAREWRKAISLGVCLLVAIFLAGCLAGRPITYPMQTLQHLFHSFGGHPLERMLVSEFKPNLGDAVFVTAVLLVLIWRVARGRWTTKSVSNPIFILAALGWLLGLKVSRFWTDWGFAAALLWFAKELEDVLEEKLPVKHYGNILLTCFLALGVYVTVTRDLGDRWTSGLTAEYLSPEKPNVSGWLPEKGGIIYNSDMDVFYKMFYKNPRAEWRYILGFEPGLMPDEDLQIYRNLQLNWFTAAAYEPWVRKMRPEDRMIIKQSGYSRPSVAGLEWHFAADLWIGRLPRTNSILKATP